eukprot:11168669-Lingulodinium_polyedra.AAC.1
MEEGRARRSHDRLGGPGGRSAAPELALDVGNMFLYATITVDNAETGVGPVTKNGGHPPLGRVVA